MLASLMRSVQERTGDGRVKQKHSDARGPGGRDDAVKPGRKVGEGAQALAWEGVTFTKLPAASASVSTSPETDPGDSDFFPFSKFGEELEESENEGRLSGELERRADSNASKDKPGRKLDFQNPLFHMPLESDSLKELQQTKATAGMFPAQDNSRATIISSNPMFSRTGTCSNGSSTAEQARSKTKDGSSGKKSSKSDPTEKGSLGSRKVKEKEEKKEEKKKEKAVYEHVGRIDVRPSDFAREKKNLPPSPPEGTRRTFRVDTFARNEGNDNGVAHFKFVFTYEPGNTEITHRVRPVLDAVHERDTGKLRVAVNDGRVATAMRSAIEVVLPGIGAVLFNPRMQAKGHHLYTLSLGSFTLFSVLA